MSTSGGFDVYYEISAKQAGYQLGAGLGIPKEVERHVTPRPGMELCCHLLLSSLQITFVPSGRRISILIQFEESSVVAGAQHAFPLAGTIRYDNVPLEFVNQRTTSGTTRFLRADLTGKHPKTQLDDTSRERLNRAFPLPGPKTAADIFEAEASAAAEQFLTAQPLPDTFPPGGLPMAPPGAPDVLDPLPKFRETAAVCPDPQTLAILGQVLAASNGDPTTKSRTVQEGEAGCVGFGINLIRKFICRGLAIERIQDLEPNTDGKRKSQTEAKDYLDAHPDWLDRLPGSCGSAGSIPYKEGFALANITTTIGSTAIVILLHLERSESCADIKVLVGVNITFDVATARTPLPKVSEPRISADVDMNFWCQLGAAFSVGLFAPVIAGTVFNTLHYLDLFGGELLSAFMPTMAVPGLDLPLSIPVKDAVVYGDDSVRFCGNLRVRPPQYERGADIRIDQKVLSKTPTGHGTYHLDATSVCPAGDFPYKLFNQEWELQLSLDCHLLARPLQRVTWGIYQNTVNGTGITYLEVPTYAALPPNLSVRKAGTAQIHYETPRDNCVGGTRLVLRNVPTDGNYTLSIHAEVVDARGNKVTTAVTTVVYGELAELPQDYYDHVKQCLLNEIKLIQNTIPSDVYNNLFRPQPDPRITPIAIEQVIGPILQFHPRPTDALNASFRVHGMDHTNAVTNFLRSGIYRRG